MNVKDCLVFEEVAVGMFTARAAGARVIAVSETHIDARAPLGATLECHRTRGLQLSDAPTGRHALTTRSSLTGAAVP
jgi:beta-phosphoglucomutase-like phosphatase (HAD superfamily)